jgi:flagellar biosynthesis protein FlhA
LKFKDASVPIIVVGIVIAIILPIPGFFLDILIAINLMLSVIILLNTVYLKEPLQLSVFPSLLEIDYVRYYEKCNR